MAEKKKLLICGIIMNCGGTEKSFLAFADCLDYEKYDVDLLLCKKEGELLGDIPPQIRVLDFPDPALADMFLLSGKNAAKTIWRCFGRRNPLVLFEVFPYFVKILLQPKKRSETATRLSLRLLRHFTPLEQEYDAAAAYWGDRSMFYMVDKVRAKKKIAWLHFDFDNPPRSEEIYGGYFEKCDAVVTVSHKINETMRRRFPALADRFVTIENINNARLIRRRALESESFPDRIFRGQRVLTIARISEQKGLDFVLEALVKMRADNLNVRWYVIGGGDKAEVDALKARAVDMQVADMFILLGTRMNPYPFLRDCDVYVQPSRYEGKPITVEEAKMLYKPIVATNYVSAREQLEDGRLGMIVDIDADSLYRGVRRMLEDPELRDRYTDTLAGRDFGNESEIRRFDELLED